MRHIIMRHIYPLNIYIFISQSSETFRNHEDTSVYILRKHSSRSVCQNSCSEIFKNFLGKLKKMECIFKKLQVFNLQIFQMHSIYFDFLYESRNFSEQLLADAFDSSVPLDCHFLLQEHKQNILILCKLYDWQHRATELRGYQLK